MQWTKVGMGEVIDPKGDGPGTETVGKYLGSLENVGPNNSKMHNLEVDGKQVQIWGTTVLDARFEQIPAGKYVKIVYLGLEKSPTQGRSSFHNFDVFVGDGAPESEDTAPQKEGEAQASEEDAELPF